MVVVGNMQWTSIPLTLPRSAASKQFVNILTATQPLTLSSLASLPAEHQKNLVGERLYPLVRRVHPELAGKITGMLLELTHAELLHLIETPDALRLKVERGNPSIEAVQLPKRPSRSLSG